MSYQVLARKWRPSRFDEVVGQQHVLQALVNALEQQRLHHAYLFSGTRGVGKTSIARLLAKCLNCDLGVSATPCGECESCQQIEQGRFIDLIEIDAASRTKVEDTREILDNVQYKPTRARYKIYLIDEVHMLSRSSFNALLKTLEEPPEHVKFLFATTETQKLPVTILSRCLQFNLKALSPRQIANQLNTILSAENVAFDDGALNLLSQSAKGSMRDALSLTDQAISHASGNLSKALVGEMLGTIDVDHSAKLLNFALQGNSDALFNYSDEVAQLSPNFDALLGQMIDSVHFASMAKLVKNSARLADQPRAVIELAQFDAELLQLFYSVLIQGRQELPLANDPHSGFEMVLLRLIAFMPKPPTNTVQSIPVSAGDDDVATVLAQEQASLIEQAQTQRNTKGPSGLAQVRAALQEQQKTVHNTESKTVSRDTSQPQTAVSSNEQQSDEGQDKFAKQGSTNVELSAIDKLDSSVPSAQSQSEQKDPFTPEIKPTVDAQLSQQAPPVQHSKSISNTPSTQFSEEEMMNMSMALAHEEPGDYEPIDINQTQLINDEQAAQSPSASTTANSTFNAGDINAFLKAKNDLKSKRVNAEDDTEKKPQAVNDNVVNQRGNRLPDLESDVITKNIASLPVVDSSNLVKETQEIPVDNTSSDESPVALLDDPALLLAPNSQDPWTLLIEDMALGGRLRQLAIHSVYERNDKVVHLLLAHEHRHLNAETAVDALSKKLALLLELPIELIIEIGDNDIKTPYQIAQELHQERLLIAAQRIKEDDGVIHFIEQFDANLVDESIKYRTLKAIS